MLVRIIMGLILFPIAVFLIMLGGVPLRITLFVLSALASVELYKSFNIKSFKINHYASFISIGVYYFLVLPYASEANSNFFIFIVSMLIINLVFLVIRYENIKIKDVLINFLVPLYPTILLSTVYLALEQNTQIAWLMFLCAWGYDTCAYFVGKLIGKRKFTPKLSPNKTLEGFLGGVVGAMIISFVYLQFIIAHDYTLYLTAFASLIAISGQLGDLVASAIKRENGIKDFGTLIPGHGGIFDRFDSLMFTAPVTYMLILFLV